MNINMIIGLIFSIIGAIFAFVGGIVGFALYTQGKPEWQVSFVFISIGLGFLIAGAVFFALFVAAKRKRTRLMSEGDCYEAEISDIYEVRNVYINGRYPYVIECTYTDKAGKKYLVKSEYIFINSEQEYRATRARVWVDKYEPKQYYVERYLSEQYSDENKDIIDLR